jgi:PhzF family phenazine biosynthesis protein
LKPSLPKLKELGTIFNCTGYYIFTLGDEEGDALTYGRMFTPQIGIDEDPVTGMAITPLVAYIAKNKIIPLGGPQLSFHAIQGEAMGQPGVAEVCVTSVNGGPSKIDVSGEAVIVFKAELEI